MKIFSAAQIKNWDAFTIENEPIESSELMERAAMACCRWILDHKYSHRNFLIFCGTGNNGGDGLAIGRILLQSNCSATVYITGETGTKDFEANLEKIQLHGGLLPEILTPGALPVITPEMVVVDALIGTGLNRPPAGISAELIDHINSGIAPVISIDMPSGLFADTSSKGNSIVKATHTLTFQQFKLAFLLPENDAYCGEVHILNIGLDKTFENETEVAFELTERTLIRSICKSRKKFSHKGNYGHAALLCGSYGMMGAAVLAAHSCLRSGAGKLTAYIPECGYTTLQSVVPEAMCVVSGEKHIAAADGIGSFDAVGIGPGIGKFPSHVSLLRAVFTQTKKSLLVDADALNMIAGNKELIGLIPFSSVLTPHPGEFERLFGAVENDFERLQLALKKSAELQVYIVLKGQYTFISTPEGKGWFNSTGNSGMATAGSGDVLSGFITGLLAQGYPPPQAALIGVYLHGLAGDIASQRHSPEAMIAGDIVDCLGEAFKLIS